MIQNEFFDLFSSQDPTLCISGISRRVSFFTPHTIILAKGSMTDAFRRRFVSDICNTYPEATIQEAPNIPHSKVRIEGRTLMARHQRGKQTLVLGELRNSVRFSEEMGNSCPHYWHFSPYGFCPYNCLYCYLAGTMGVKFSPSVKVFVNIYKMLDRIDRYICSDRKI
jgi:spore photoproduct lyase